MTAISPSIWAQDKHGEWKLYFNTEEDSSSPLSQAHKEDQKNKKNINVSDKNLILGTLMMSPKGIGRLIKNNNGVAYIRFNQDTQEYQFPIESITNYFNCFIVFIIKGNIDMIRLKLKVDGKVENIFEELSKINKINITKFNYNLVYNKSMLKNETTFEQLKLQNNAKILIYETSTIEYKISRYLSIQKFWYSNIQDGISFSVTKDIYLLGAGIFCSHDNNVISGTLKILEGPNISGKVLMEENAEIQPSQNKSTPVGKIKFSKGVLCRKNMDYSLIFLANICTNTYSGGKGMIDIEGEKNVIFTFKKLIGNKGGTNATYGNFPEIYYNIK